MQKVLITGADGFIGSNLTKHLNRKNRCIIPVGRGVDLTEYSNVEDILNRYQPDVVIHLAAKVGVNIWSNDDSSLLKNNLIIDTNLAEALSTLDVKPRVIYASSSEVYNDRRKSEDSPISINIKGPRSYYAMEKLIGEKLFGDINLRLFNIIGPGQKTTFAIPKMVQCALHNEPINASSDIRAFCDVKDLAGWTNVILKRIDSLGPNTYNIGNPLNTYSMVDVAKMIIKRLNSKSAICKVEDGFCPSREPNIAKSINLYAPRVLLSDSILNIAKYLNKEVI